MIATIWQDGLVQSADSTSLLDSRLLEEAETLRKRWGRETRRRLVQGFAIGFPVATLALVALGDPGAFKAVAAGTLLGGIFALFYFVLAADRSLMKRFDEAYRRAITVPLLREAAPGASLEPEAGIDAETFRQAGLFRYRPTSYRSTNRLALEAHGRGVTAANVTAAYRSRRADDARTVAIFGGMFAVIELEREARAVIARPRVDAPAFTSRFVKQKTQPAVTERELEDLERVDLGSGYWAENFEVYAARPEDGRAFVAHVLDPVLQRVSAFVAPFLHEPGFFFISLRGPRMYIARPSGWGFLSSSYQLSATQAARQARDDLDYAITLLSAFAERVAAAEPGASRGAPQA